MMKVTLKEAFKSMEEIDDNVYDYFDGGEAEITTKQLPKKQLKEDKKPQQEEIKSRKPLKESKVKKSQLKESQEIKKPLKERISDTYQSGNVVATTETKHTSVKNYAYVNLTVNGKTYRGRQSWINRTWERFFKQTALLDAIRQYGLSSEQIDKLRDYNSFQSTLDAFAEMVNAPKNDEKVECKESKEQLTEGTSNFGSLEYLPLLVFYNYEDELDNMHYASDFPKESDFEDEDGNVDEDAYLEARDQFDEKYFNELDAVALTEDEWDSLEEKIKQFNIETKDMYQELCYDKEKGYHNYDKNGDLEDIEVKIEPGYYEAYQLDVDDRLFDYLEEDVKKQQLERFQNFFQELKNEFGLTELGVSWRASNGETGYHKVESKQKENNNKSLKEATQIDIMNEDEVEKGKELIQDNKEGTNTDEVEQIVDVDAETVDELKDSYVGNVILQCPVCRTLIYKKPDLLKKDEENTPENPKEQIWNVGEQCPHCGSEDGYYLVGQVASMDVTPDKEDEETTGKDEVETDEVEDEIKDGEVPTPVEEEPIETEEEEDVTFESLDIDRFNGIANTYLTEVYSNVDSFTTTNATVDDANNKLVIEGIINYKSGKTKNTKFEFLGESITKDNKYVFKGLNETFAKGNDKAFTLKASINNSTLISESLDYDYTVTNTKLNESKVVKGSTLKESIYTIEINNEIYCDEDGNSYRFNSSEEAQDFIDEHELEGATITRQYGFANGK